MPTSRSFSRAPSYTAAGSYASGGRQASYTGVQSSFVSPGKQTTKEALKRSKKPLSMKHCTSIIDGLKTIYFNKVRLLSVSMQPMLEDACASRRPRRLSKDPRSRFS